MIFFSFNSIFGDFFLGKREYSTGYIVLEIISMEKVHHKKIEREKMNTRSHVSMPWFGFEYANTTKLYHGFGYLELTFKVESVQKGILRIP
jgi:hypothetical protein